MDIGEAVTALREGKRVYRSGWTGASEPAYLVLIPGRELEASYKPMVDHLGEGTRFRVEDHVDAMYAVGNGRHLPVTMPACQIGYQFTQADILASDWRSY